MKKFFLRTLAFLIFSSYCVTIHAQFLDKLSVEVDYQLKFSVGDATTQDLDVYWGTLRVNQQLEYENPVNQLLVALNYKLNQTLNLGIGAGLNVVKYLPNPTRFNAFYDRVSAPLFLKLSYTYQKERWAVIPQVLIGYQFAASYLDSYQTTWTLIEYGGLMTGFDMRFMRMSKKYAPYFLVGYEFNQFNNERNLYVFDGTNQILYQEDVRYKTFCHLLKFGVGISF